MDWIDWLVSAKEWKEKVKLAGNVCAIYTPKDELHQVFSGTGELIRPMELRLTGDIKVSGMIVGSTDTVFIHMSQLHLNPGCIKALLIQIDAHGVLKAMTGSLAIVADTFDHHVNTGFTY